MVKTSKKTILNCSFIATFKEVSFRSTGTFAQYRDMEMTNGITT